MIRDALGSDAILSRGAGEIALNEEVVRVDVREFDAAMAATRLTEAVQHYRGDFLQSFYLSDAPEFERWADQERTRLRQAALKAAFLLVHQHEEAGEYQAAVEHSRWAVRVAPLDERAFRQLLELLDRHGDRSTALQEYDVFAARLANDYGVDPSPETQALIARIRTRATPHTPSQGLSAGSELDSRHTTTQDDELLALLQTGLGDLYTIERELGRGGMSVVYLARDLRLRRQVAIKILRPELAASIAADRFLQEIQLGAAIDHPNVIHVFESGEAANLPYYVMQYVAGESLRDRLKREPQLPIDEAIRITKSVAEALEAAHAKGIVHRDIKPANILLDGNRVIVSDFGIARALSEAGATELTVTGIAIGTPGYMSPQQATGDPVDHRTDQYSLACVLYEMLAGEMVFAGHTARAIIAKHAAAEPPPLSVLRREAAHLDVVIKRALAKAPADRFERVSEFAAALDTPSHVRWRPPGALRILKTARAHPGLVGLAALLVVLLGQFASRTFAEASTPAWGEGRPESIVVLPFAEDPSDNLQLLTEITDQVGHELNWWNRVRAVGTGALSGIIHDLGYRGSVFQSSEAALRVAREVDAEALVGITLRTRSDSLVVDGALYDVRSGKLVDRTLTSIAEASDREALVNPIVFGVLGIGDRVADPVLRGTSDADAIVANDQGIRELEQVHLTEAEQLFRNAVAHDSSYATALTNLAQTLYWQTTEGLKPLAVVGPEIARLSAIAMESLGSTTFRDSIHTRAFYAFQMGDFAGARSLYNEILRSDATDVHAWAMLGAVEFNDPWLMNAPDGTLLPRANLNRALHAFAEAIRLRPTFELGYARFREIYHDIEGVLDVNRCPGYEMPRDEFVPIWAEPAETMPQNMRSFCPVVLDSVQWVTRAQLSTLNRRALETGADRVLQQSITMLQRWAAFSRNAPRPRQALAQAIIARRARIRVGPPERLRGLALEALDYALAASSLTRDTTSEDLAQLSNLYLATGQLDSATALARRSLGLSQREPNSRARSSSAANVFVAVGQPEQALALTARSSPERFIRDSLTGEFLSYSGLDRLYVLAAAGITGERFARELDAMVGAWTRSGYDDRQQRLLRNHLTLRLSAAFAQDTAAMMHWDETISVNHPAWLALKLSMLEPTVAQANFLDALDSDAEFGTVAMRAFVLGKIASRLGLHRQAIQLFSRIDSVPHRVDDFDPGWGLQVISHLIRSKEYHAIGMDGEATAELDAFLTAWRNPDGLTRPMVREALALQEDLANR